MYNGSWGSMIDVYISSQKQVLQFWDILSLKRHSDHNAFSASTFAILFQGINTQGVTLSLRTAAASLLDPLQARRAVAGPLLRHCWHLPPEAVHPTGTLLLHTHTHKIMMIINILSIFLEPCRMCGENFLEAAANAKVDWQVLRRIHHLSFYQLNITWVCTNWKPFQSFSNWKSFQLCITCTIALLCIWVCIT